MSREIIDATVAGHCLAVLDGKKAAILLLAERLAKLSHPSAEEVMAIHGKEYYCAPRDESLAVLLAVPNKMGWRLACDFAEHYMRKYHADTFVPPSVPFAVVESCRAWLGGRFWRKPSKRMLSKAPRYYQSWAGAKDGNRAAVNALCGILAFSATGGKEPAWQHRHIRDQLVCCEKTYD